MLIKRIISAVILTGLSGVLLIAGAARPVFALSVSDYFTYTYSFVFSTVNVADNQTFTVTVNGQAVCTQDLPLTVTAATMTSKVVAKNRATGAEVIINSNYSMSYSSGFPTHKGESADVTVQVPLTFPVGSAAGVYDITGVLLSASVKVGITIDVTNYLPASQEMGTVNYSVSGGGTPTVTTTTTTSTPAPGLTDVTTHVGPTGLFLDAITALSENKSCVLNIPQNVRGLTADGNKLTQITIIPVTVPSAATTGFSVLGTFYEIGPSAATFNPAITISISYAGVTLPPGTSEKDIVICYVDAQGKSNPLPTTLDAVNKIATAQTTHFTPYGLLIPVVVPASYTTANLVISPPQVGVNEKATAAITATNTGAASATFSVDLQINGKVTDTKQVTLAAGASSKITFSIIPDKAGIYNIAIGTESAQLTVTGAIITNTTTTTATVATSATVAPAQSPANFTLSELKVLPAEIESGKRVTATARLTNSGEQTGTFEAVLYVDGQVVNTQNVDLVGHSSQMIGFTHQLTSEGEHTIAIGSLSQNIKVDPASTTDNSTSFWVIGGLAGVALGVLIGGGVLLLLKSRKH